MACWDFEIPSHLSWRLELRVSWPAGSKTKAVTVLWKVEWNRQQEWLCDLRQFLYFLGTHSHVQAGNNYCTNWKHIWSLCVQVPKSGFRVCCGHWGELLGEQLFVMPSLQVSQCSASRRRRSELDDTAEAQGKVNSISCTCLQPWERGWQWVSDCCLTVPTPWCWSLWFY